MALRTGASLVPVFSFGENDLFDTVPQSSAGPLLARALSVVQRKLGFSVPLFHGAASGASSGLSIPGVLPHRHAIVSVVGAPIVVDAAIAEPTEEQIDHYHELYLYSLRALWDEHKDELAPKRNKSLDFGKPEGK